MRNRLFKRRGTLAWGRHGIEYHERPGVLISMPYRLRRWRIEGWYRTATERDAVLRALGRSKRWRYRVAESEGWRPWVRPMVKPRKRVHAKMRAWRDQYLSRLWAGGGYGNRRYRHKARGLRIWLSARYPDARRPRL